MNDLQRAFIHEMGHFIAAELNYKLCNYDRRIDEFKLYLRDNSTILYDGYVRTKNVVISDRFNHEIIANYFGNAVYGCLFESLYRKIDLDQCLCDISIEENLLQNFGNGQDDYYEIFIRLRLVENELKSVFDKWRSYLFDDYFNQLHELKNRNHFKSVFSLDVNDYILKKRYNEYLIDIDKLKLELNEFLEFHKPFFEQFLERLFKIQHDDN